MHPEEPLPGRVLLEMLEGAELENFNARCQADILRCLRDSGELVYEEVIIEEGLSFLL